jgi:hypothetical protein
LLLKVFAYVSVKALFCQLSKVDHQTRQRLNDWTTVQQLAREWQLVQAEWIESFRAELSTPERKYFAYLGPCLAIRDIVRTISKSDCVKCIAQPFKYKFLDSHFAEGDKSCSLSASERSTRFLFSPDHTHLQKMIHYLHNKRGLQLPAFLQQLGSSLSYFGLLKSRYFTYCFFPYGYSLELESTSSKSKEEEEEEEELSLAQSIQLMLTTSAVLPVIYYDWAGHGDGGECLLSTFLDPKLGCARHGAISLVETADFEPQKPIKPPKQCRHLWEITARILMGSIDDSMMNPFEYANYSAL